MQGRPARKVRLGGQGSLAGTRRWEEEGCWWPVNWVCRQSAPPPIMTRLRGIHGWSPLLIKPSPGTVSARPGSVGSASSLRHPPCHGVTNRRILSQQLIMAWSFVDGDTLGLMAVACSKIGLIYISHVFPIYQ